MINKTNWQIEQMEKNYIVLSNLELDINKDITEFVNQEYNCDPDDYKGYEIDTLNNQVDLIFDDAKCLVKFIKKNELNVDFIEDGIATRIASDGKGFIIEKHSNKTFNKILAGLLK